MPRLLGNLGHLPNEYRDLYKGMEYMGLLYLNEYTKATIQNDIMRTMVLSSAFVLYDNMVK